MIETAHQAEVKKKMVDLGFSPEESDIYLYLFSSGKQSVLSISKTLAIPRTSVYRYLEGLKSRGLVEEVLDGKTKSFKSSSPTNLKMVLIRKEEDFKREKREIECLIESLNEPEEVKKQKSEVLHYKGTEGLKQLTWNSLKARGALRIFEVGNMVDFVSKDFAEKVRDEFVRREIRIHELTNKSHFGPWTNVHKLYKELWKCKYLNPRILHVDTEMMIYNDVYAIYGFKDGDYWGVEVHNKELARMQKQVFDSYWKISQSMIVGEGGSSKAVGR